jgi:UDP-N-acetylmuramoylalanine--D-glutamate ligase
MLKKAGYNVGLAGNVGVSFAWQVATENFDYYVLEISSFQLDGMYDFKAEIAVLLNITPDHLDRYDYNFENMLSQNFGFCKIKHKRMLLYISKMMSALTQYLDRIDTLAQKIPFTKITTLHAGPI